MSLFCFRRYRKTINYNQDNNNNNDINNNNNNNNNNDIYNNNNNNYNNIAVKYSAHILKHVHSVHS